MKKLNAFLICVTVAVSGLAVSPTFTVDASRPAGKVSPKLYGLVTKEINHSYDGGLYAELIQNRAFLDNANVPVMVIGSQTHANLINRRIPTLFFVSRFRLV
jgi:alpha-N-arabinofuranosidase